YTGKEEIIEYFNGVPERLGSGVIEFLKLEVNETTAYFRWKITDDQKIISGKDMLTIKDGQIQHQEVTLLTEDF
ncbi:MAG: nuclear transport factor 2 family protein, partial [Actinomycetota bacterium]|nr:nuclear transport factor 2 family protein [Actinomycetota bacterium]